MIYQSSPWMPLRTSVLHENPAVFGCTSLQIPKVHNLNFYNIYCFGVEATCSRLQVICIINVTALHLGECLNY